MPSIIRLINRKQTSICISGEQNIKEMRFSQQMKVWYLYGIWLFPSKKQNNINSSSCLKSMWALSKHQMLFPLTSQAQANVPSSCYSPKLEMTCAHRVTSLHFSQEPVMFLGTWTWELNVQVPWGFSQVPSDDCYLKHCMSVEDEVFKAVRCKKQWGQYLYLF